MTHRADYLEQEMITELREPCAVKVACTVLKGESGGNPADLLRESMTEALPFQTQQPIFNKMGGISELSHMDSEERRKYFNSLNKYRTNLSVMQNEHEEGFTEGRHEKAVEIARNAKDMRLDASLISKLTGLSISEIESL